MPKHRDLWSLTATLSLCLVAQAGGTPPNEVPKDVSNSTGRIAPPKRLPAPVEEAVQPAGEILNTASMPREVRRAVVADAAKRFRVAESAVVLTGAEQVTWGDGSLGCPQPGMAYTQALVPGYRVTAKTAAGQFVYHTDERGNVVTCGSLPRRERALPRK